MTTGQTLEQFGNALEAAHPNIHVPIRPVPSYKEIVGGSRWLGIIGGLYLAFGWIVTVFIIGAVIFRVILIAMRGDSLHELMKDWPELVGSFGAGLGLICVGSLICMVRSLSLAVRDIAQNSFYK